MERIEHKNKYISQKLGKRGETSGPEGWAQSRGPRKAASGVGRLPRPCPVLVACGVAAPRKRDSRPRAASPRPLRHSQSLVSEKHSRSRCQGQGMFFSRRRTWRTPRFHGWCLGGPLTKPREESRRAAQGSLCPHGQGGRPGRMSQGAARLSRGEPGLGTLVEGRLPARLVLPEEDLDLKPVRAAPCDGRLTLGFLF